MDTIVSPDTDWTDHVKFALRDKHAISIRLDSDVLAWFRSKGPGYQTHINAVLRSYYEAHTAGR